MTFQNGHTWYWHDDQSFKVLANRINNIIHLRCTAGHDTADDYSVGSHWTWKGDEESFRMHWKLADPESFPYVAIWLNVIQWHDGTTSFDRNGPYDSWAEAFDSYTEDPHDEYGNSCTLVKTIEVRHYL